MRRKFIFRPSLGEEGRASPLPGEAEQIINLDAGVEVWFHHLRGFCIQLDLKSKYDIGPLLGKGNFAQVYEITHVETGTTYALKTLNKQQLIK